LKPGTDAHKHWRDDLNTLVNCFKTMQSQGVVVIWRPLHEMNGNWFWWCKRPGDGYQRLWRHMFNYFKDQGVNNLLWLYAPNAGEVWGDYLKYYPGDNYVDLVGLDRYDTDWGSASGTGWNELKSKGKPICISETGAHPVDRTVPMDWANLLNGLKGAYRDAVYFQVWNSGWSMHQSRHSNVKSLLNDPVVLNRPV
jgi:mannan endo-1,4-beta-mannosidase